MPDTLIREQEIRRGQRIVMCYASANRDEDVYVNPGTFDVARQPNDNCRLATGRTSAWAPALHEWKSGRFLTRS